MNRNNGTEHEEQTKNNHREKEEEQRDNDNENKEWAESNLYVVKERRQQKHMEMLGRQRMETRCRLTPLRVRRRIAPKRNA